MSLFFAPRALFRGSHAGIASLLTRSIETVREHPTEAHYKPSPLSHKPDTSMINDAEKGAEANWANRQDKQNYRDLLARISLINPHDKQAEGELVQLLRKHYIVENPTLVEELMEWRTKVYRDLAAWQSKELGL